MAIVRTSTVEVVFTVKAQDENGTLTPVNLTSVSGLTIIAYNEGGQTVGKYSKNYKEGYGDIDLAGTGTDAANGVGIIRVQSTESAKAIVKTLKLEFHVFQNNTNFDDATQHDIATGVELEEVVEPYAKNETKD